MSSGMSAPPSQRPSFEPRLVRLHKRRAARGFADAAFLHRRAADDLAERLEAIPRAFGRVLIYGAAGVAAASIAARPELARRIGNVTKADLAPELAGDAVAFAPDAWPFAPESFDLILSPLTLHWANDLPGALVQSRRALKPDGLLLATVFGGETLMELRLALIEAETALLGGASPRIAPFAELQDLAGLLQRAGFALPAADKDRVTVRYSDPLRLLADLRAMGETNALAARAPHALSRRLLSATLEAYRARASDEDGRVRATFDLMTLTGWAPHASQQQPLKPGSAKARLADVLGVEERSAGEKPNR
jgi:SAM-dependent methyltransferase